MSAPKASKKAVKKAAKKTSKNAMSAKAGQSLKAVLEAAPGKAFPKKIVPMLATLVDKPFNEPGWIYEVKWDGYRALAFLNKGRVELRSRNNKVFNEKFYPLTQALKTRRLNAVLDGEIVVSAKNGASNFGSLQNWRSEADGDLVYHVFDILWYEGKDLTKLALSERKRILKKILPNDSFVHYGDHFTGSGIDFFEHAKELDLEGIMAKRTDSTYQPGERSKDWLKVKANKRQEMVIGGFTRNEDSPKAFSSLLVGVYEGRQLVYTGKVGTGFNTALQKEMMKQFKPLITSVVPFTREPDVNKPSRFRPDPPRATVTWLKPELVCEVSYTEMTSDGIMRHPSFEGMRPDKKPGDVVREIAKSAKATVKKTAKISKPVITAQAARSRRSLLNPTDETQVRSINGHELKFTNLSKIYWPKEKITKRDLLNYYYQVAPYILPYLKDRPQSMLRNPDGIAGFSFYYKNIKGKAPAWIETYDYYSETDGEDKEYLVAKDEASLLYMASLGCIEMNPWHSRVQNEDNPDWCIIDLDPAKNSFNQVIEAARVCKEVLDSFDIPAYPKTSGSTGIHIYIPLGAKYAYEQSKEFARIIARLVHQEIPEYTSIERAVKDRKEKMYIDFLQNRPQATVAAPYSVRPKPGATVSMPLHWEEVKKGLKMTDFTLRNAIERIKSEGDIFKPVLGKGINLERFIKAYEKK